MSTATQLPNKQRSTQWVIGWKIANLIVSNSGELGFMPLNQDGIIKSYSFDAVAECAQFPSHKAPHAGHHCGFNAYHDQSQAREHLRRAMKKPGRMYVPENLILMRVGLYGRVQEGTYPGGEAWGYKASRQRVANVFIPRQCAYNSCHLTPTHLGVRRDDKLSPLWNAHYLRPLCQMHVHDAEHVFNLPELTRKTGARFAWDSLR